jgi:outer membrane protein assembly factor BamD (BamD/ComL family)
MRREIALVDAARTAVKSGDPERALALIHRYDTTFPSGAFRPEVAALRIESLAADGQTDLARAGARDFIAAHPESPLSARLARIAGAPSR